MRVLVIFLIALAYRPAFAQYEYLKLDKGQVYFEKIFMLDSVGARSVEQVLTLGIPKLKDVTDFYKSGDIITAKITNAKIDYKRYGGKWGSTPAILNHPFFGDVSIVWKDNRYRVTVSNIYFNAAGVGTVKGTDLLAKKQGTEINSSKMAVSAGQYISQYLSDLFTIAETKGDDW